MNMAVREGLTRFARPFGSYVKKKPVLSYELFLEYGGEGGIDSLRSPFGQSPRKLVVCPT
ncbi:hypothetical protein BKQ87_003605, partial [Salmonella enterica subsp. enterica serovar Berta]|nr:hypothetical protein [Salmonella enterica subsp. enterica serovar Berta]